MMPRSLRFALPLGCFQTLLLFLPPSVLLFALQQPQWHHFFYGLSLRLTSRFLFAAGLSFRITGAFLSLVDCRVGIAGSFGFLKRGWIGFAVLFACFVGFIAAAASARPNCARISRLRAMVARRSRSLCQY